jgi:LPXTG-motif cell wall-anchored protein
MLVLAVRRRSRLVVIAMVAMTLTFVAGLSLLGNPAFADPAGNNGTVKMDLNEPFDDNPDNEPHVTCPFQVDFYGFDEGDLTATVTFEAHEPTTREGDDQVLLTDEVAIGEDDNSGGGSESGLDASATYTLDFTGITPQDQQGFHVMLTVNAEGSQGADTKHKVFWVEECETNDTTTTTTTTSSSTTTSSTSTTTSLGGSDTSGGGSESSLENAAAERSGLPKTGSNSLPLAVAGLALLGLGAASLLASNRRQRHSRT